MTLTGVYVPLITPFDAAGAVAVDALAALATEVLDGGATGITALGTTGEPASLTAGEQRRVVDILAGVCRDRGAPLLVGASTVAAVTALRDRPGVTAALCVVPPFVCPGEAGVVAHIAAVAAASPVPLVVYHVPHRTGQELSAATIRRLAAIPGVIGIKYATGGIDATVVDLLAEPEPSGTFTVLGGDDVVLSPLLTMGAGGGIVASAHLATGHFVDLVAAWRAGDVERARPLGHRLAVLSAALFAAPNPTVIKAVLHAQGRIPTASVRLPLLRADADMAQRALLRLEELCCRAGR
jgi:4-hydroxy-tetrahydrodipicolinate synthase